MTPGTANTSHIYITGQHAEPSSVLPNLTPANTMSTFYTPTDPNLTASQALPFLQNCIDRVAQVAVLTGSSEESIRRHFSEHPFHFDTVLRVLDQAFQLHDTAPPNVVARTDNTTGTALTATSGPEPDYCTTHDPSLGYYNPYLTMVPQNLAPYLSHDVAPPGETSATDRLHVDQDAK